MEQFLMIEVNWETGSEMSNFSIVETEMDIGDFTVLLFVIWFKSVFVLIKLAIFDGDFGDEKTFALFGNIKVGLLIFFC